MDLETIGYFLTFLCCNLYFSLIFATQVGKGCSTRYSVAEMHVGETITSTLQHSTLIAGSSSWGQTSCSRLHRHVGRPVTRRSRGKEVGGPSTSFFLTQGTPLRSTPAAWSYMPLVDLSVHLPCASNQLPDYMCWAYFSLQSYLSSVFYSFRPRFSISSSVEHSHAGPFPHWNLPSLWHLP